MARAKRVLNGDGQHYGYRFHCPGCDEEHVIPTKPHEPGWGSNDDADRPTFTPSIHVLPHKAIDEDGSVVETFRCHSFVTDGRIQFLGDSTHSLAGQTVDLPELE